MPKSASSNEIETHQDSRHPRMSREVVGHSHTLHALQKAWDQNRFPHGLILAGPKGIGKATLAYQIARTLLNTSSPVSFQREDHQDLSKTDHLIRANNHPDLFTLEKSIDEKGKISKDIPIDRARSVVTFFSQTSIDDNWRIAIIDCVEDLSTKGANALLKILEEPPRKCLLILISHNQSGILPTLRSRCQILSCHPLNNSECKSVLTGHGIAKADDYLPYCQGSPGIGLEIVDLGGNEFIKAFSDLVLACEAQDFRGLQPFLDRYVFKPLVLSPDRAYFAFCRVLQSWMAGHVSEPHRLVNTATNKLATSWFSVQDLLKQSHVFALDRKQTLVSVFYDLYGYNTK